MKNNFLNFDQIFVKKKIPFSRQNIRDISKMLRKKFHYFKKNFTFSSDDFFYKSYIFCLLMKNFIKTRNFWFPKKVYEIRKKGLEQNCLSQEDIQMHFRTFEINNFVS